MTPPNDKGPVDVQVMFDDGSAFKIANGFRYVEPADGEAARRAFFTGQKGGGGEGQDRSREEAVARSAAPLERRRRFVRPVDCRAAAG